MDKFNQTINPKAMQDSPMKKLGWFFYQAAG